MQRLRGSWLALLGASLLVLFSISVAAGADPKTDANRGQSISGFVHSLIFGEPATYEEGAPDGSQDEDEQGSQGEEGAPDGSDDEDGTEGDADEAGEASLVSGAEHGPCISEVAGSDAVGGPNENHGGAVSEAARETCWEEQATEEEPTDPVEEDLEEFSNHGECVSEVAHSDEVGGPNENHGGAVSEAAHETCPEGDEEEEAAEAEVVESGAELQGRGNNGNGNGGGHGRGRGGGNGGGRGHDR